MVFMHIKEGFFTVSLENEASGCYNIGVIKKRCEKECLMPGRHPESGDGS